MRATFTGVMFESARSTGTLSWTNLTFSGTLSDGVGRYLSNTGTQAVTLVSPTPNSTGATSACGCTGLNYKTGFTINWP